MPRRSLVATVAVIAFVARLSTLLLAAALTATAADSNWPQFRGPGAAGVATNPNLPDRWSASENVAWKSELPGRSWSSPIVWNDQVFLTAVVSTGESEPPKKGLYFGGDRPEPSKAEHHWKVLRLDLETGAMIWEATVHQGAPRTPIHLKSSYGAETPVTDGQRIYALFGGVGIFALNLNGEEAWSVPLTPRKTRYGWGTASSPVLHQGRLFVVDDNDERSELLILDAATGRELHRIARDEKSNWATPFLWENGARTELITPGSGEVRSYDMEGRVLWSLRGMSSIAIPTPFAGDGLLYVASGYVGDKLRPLYAIRPGATGDISLEPGATNNAFIAWSDPVGAPYNPSPLYHDGRLYVLYDRGLLTCRDARTGRVLYDRERLPEGMAFTASPWAAGDRIFCLNEDGVCYVLRAGDRFELLHRNTLAEDDMCMATPALAGERLLIRTASRLYCLRRTPNPDDLILADFEGNDYGAWRTTGEAFGPGPARGRLPGQMAVDGYRGRGLVNSFHQGDGTTGTLTSPEFTIERRYIGFLIGGGRAPDATALHLIVDGRPVRTATGPNDKPGGAETLVPESWDVSEFLGRTASLRIVDTATGGWGHINIDHIVQSDRKPPGLRVDASREFEIGIDGRYLNLPIRNGAPKRVVTTLVDGRVEVRNDIELADDEPDWWAPMDVSAWRGRKVTLQIDRLREDSKALSSVTQGGVIPGADSLYREPARGQFHFSPRRGWNNDPNGMVFHNGEYHLFFQHNPYGWGWGNMHWGHAVSRDMVHWTELPDALAPDAFGPMFSGSAVVDWNNTSGLGKDGRPPLVLIYTAAGDPTVQCIASSLDGRTFTKFPGNPVLKQITSGNRDPKVIWHEPTKRWVMVLYVELEKRHTIHFFTSPNLRDWTLASITEGIPGTQYLYECPDFFELPVNGDDTQKKWVLLGANSEYAVGSFDGTTFTPEHTKLPGHQGRGFYAPQTFSDIPAHDRRRILIGWFQTETRGMPFNQSMTLPLELKLLGTAEGPRLTFTPVRELTSLRTVTRGVGAKSLEPGGANPIAGITAELVEIRAGFEPGDAREIVFTVRGAKVLYDTAKQELAVNDHRVRAPLISGRQRLTIYCDRTGLEVFAGDGRTYVPMPFQPAPGDHALAVEARGGNARLNFLEVHELRSSWRRP